LLKHPDGRERDGALKGGKGKAKQRGGRQFVGGKKKRPEGIRGEEKKNQKGGGGVKKEKGADALGTKTEEGGRGRTGKKMWRGRGGGRKWSGDVKQSGNPESSCHTR